MFERSRLTFANVVSVLALFVAVGTGGAYAASTIGSADIVDESIQSVDIKNGEVKNADVGTNAVKSDEIGDGGVRNRDILTDAVTTDKIAAGGVGPTDLADNGVTSPKVAADALTGSDVKESSLNLNGFFAATATPGSCNADGGTLLVCTATGMTLPHAGRVLATATGSWQTFNVDAGSPTDDPTLVRGRCQLAVDGSSFGQSQTMGERQQAGVASTHPSEAPGSFALPGLTSTVTAGAHTFEFDCTEED